MLSSISRTSLAFGVALAGVASSARAVSLGTPAHVPPPVAAQRATQPKIIVIPFTKADEDIRTVLEADMNRRIAITKIKEGFDNRKFTTIDFLQALRTAKESQLLNTGGQTDFKTRIVEASRADIYVEAEVGFETVGQTTSATVILTSYLAANGMSLSNKIGRSGRWQNVEISRIVERATEDKLEPFLAMMQEKFDDIAENGVPIRVEFSLSQGATKNFESTVGKDGKPLQDLLEKWIEDNAHKNGYHAGPSTESKLVFDEVRIPLKEGTTDRNFTPTKFSSQINSYLTSLNLRSSRTVAGGTIYVELR
jgi:hypothetical protein